MILKPRQPLLFNNAQTGIRLSFVHFSGDITKKLTMDG